MSLKTLRAITSAITMVILLALLVWLTLHYLESRIIALGVLIILAIDHIGDVSENVTRAFKLQVGPTGMSASVGDEIAPKANGGQDD